jgi:predicted glycosyltransferase involved in capsule biosynthesis
MMQIYSNLEVIVIDEGNDETKIVCEYWNNFINIRYFHFDKPEGYTSPAKARNIGWRKAESDYVVFTDPEVIIPLGYIATCFEYHQQNPKSITAIKPIILSQRQTRSLLDYDLLSPNMIEQISKNFQRTELNIYEHPENKYIQSRKSWRDNHFSMIPKKALIEVDGVNEKFDSWGFEGIDLIERIMSKGYKLNNFIDKKMFVYHQWHEVNRDMKKADQQRISFGIKGCGEKD